MPNTREAAPMSKMAKASMPKDRSSTRLENLSPMPVRVTVPTMMPAAAQATDTMMAFLGALLQAGEDHPALGPGQLAQRSGACRLWPAPGCPWLTLQRTRLARMLAARVLITATNPAIMGE